VGGAGGDVAAIDGAGDLDVVVGKLAELSIIETDLLLLGGDAQRQTGDQVHDEQDEAGNNERVGEAGDGVGELVGELDPVAVNPATVDLGSAVEVGDVRTGCLLVSYTFEFSKLGGGRTKQRYP
jgi:hypothetical protein